MLGTLNGALEVRGVSLDPDDLVVEATGINDVVERIPTLTEIRLTYTIRIPAEAREKLDRALATHQDKCPTAQSLKGAVKISWDAEIEVA